MNFGQQQRTLVMGICNVTPDSFSDGGQHAETDQAVAHAQAMLAAGADIVDVGGESTRPGALRPSLAEELRRVLPVVERLAADGVVVSVDTMRADVARASAAAGAAIINDVSGGRGDPAMLECAAELGLPYITMHWPLQDGELRAAGTLPYTDVVTQVLDELGERIDAALAAGIRPEHLIVDPGWGFVKSPAHNWALLRAADRIQALGYPVLYGVSRKRFLGALLRDAAGADRPPRERDAATAAITTYAALHGAWAVRTHEVRNNRDAVEVAARLRGV